jgi:two-component system, sporulation sensor kinase E
MENSKSNITTNGNDSGINELVIFNDYTSELINQNTSEKILEYFPDIVIIYRNGGILYINLCGAEILGGFQKDFINKNFWEIVHPDYRDKLNEKFKNAIISGKTGNPTEEIFFRLDNSIILVETKIKIINLDNQPVILIFGKDITEQKSNEEKLKLSLENFKSLIQNINGYIYTVNFKNGKTVNSYHSPQCKKITGYTPDEYAKDPDLWINMVYDEDKDKVNAVFMNIPSNLQKTNIEHRIVHKNGSVRWISNTFTIQLNNQKEIDFLHGFIFDITEHKISDAALEGQYLFLQKLIDTIPNPIFYKDTHGVYQGCNYAFEKYIGLQRKEIIGKTVNDTFPEEIAKMHRKKDAELFKTPGIQVYESKVTTSDQSVHDVIYYKATFKNHDDSIGGLVGVILDISEQKRVQKELTDTLERLRELEITINRSPAVIFVWPNIEGWPVAFVSDNINQFGYTPQELISGDVHFTSIIYPDDLNRVNSEVDYYGKEDISEFIQSYRIFTKDKEIRWVEDRTWAVRDEKGKITHFQGIVLDVTKRREAEQLLNESNERYRTLAENSYDLICEISNDMHFLYLSPNVNEVLGYTAEELLHKDLLQLVHIDDLGDVIRELRKDTGKTTLRYKHKNGEWLWFESAGKKFTSAGGDVRGVIVSRDITERKRLEQQLIQSERLMAVGEMAAMIAHEFRNALTSVKMILQLTSESQNLSQSEKKSFNVAVNSIYHMETVVHQLLNFTHVTPTDFNIEDINNIIKDCIPLIKIQAEKKDITLNQKYDNTIPPLLLNPSTIRESIVNILLNATQAFDEDLKASKRKISISSKRVILEKDLKDINYDVRWQRNIDSAARKAQEIILSIGAECAVIEICDNGKGIEPEYLDKIFQPFFTTREKGSGLGLPFVKRSINAHGGIISVSSKINVGTAFSIYLPINSAK